MSISQQDETNPDASASSRRRAMLVAAGGALVGLLLGIVATVGVLQPSAQSVGDATDLELACAIYGDIDKDVDALEQDYVDLPRLYAVSSLMTATADGDFESHYFDMGTRAASAIELRQPDLLRESLDEIGRECN